MSRTAMNATGRSRTSRFKAHHLFVFPALAISHRRFQGLFAHTAVEGAADAFLAGEYSAGKYHRRSEVLNNRKQLDQNEKLVSTQRGGTAVNE